jgi:hypothetical protein
MMASSVVQVIAEQVRDGMEPATWMQITSKRRALVAMDDVTLRVHIRLGRRVLNTDIRYDRGSDTYTVTRHRDWDGIEFMRSIVTEGHHAEDLSALVFSESER